MSSRLKGVATKQPVNISQRTVRATLVKIERSPRPRSIYSRVGTSLQASSRTIFSTSRFHRFHPFRLFHRSGQMSHRCLKWVPQRPQQAPRWQALRWVGRYS
ncbi:hypothetical protein B0G81_8195 [Paraburkholderia sp. BL6665CI2N2]|nr:hypothetical protein B0G81_8195 [Paraburkholderia sp. BL6665CI2N2]